MSVRELSARAVAVGVDGHSLLAGVDLEVRAGTWLTITGPSGSGKSLLLQVLSGLRRPQSGQVLIDGRPLDGAAGPVPGIVLQDYALVPFLTATETVALPLQAARASATEIESRARRWIDAVGLRPAGDQAVSNLSGGQRQRVAIARALALESGLLFLDEPTAELDVANRTAVLTLLREQVSQGTILVAISHDQAVWDVSNVIMTTTPSRTLLRAPTQEPLK